MPQQYPALIRLEAGLRILGLNLPQNSKKRRAKLANQFVSLPKLCVQSRPRDELAAFRVDAV